MHLRRSLPALLLAASCGGGSGSETPSPAPPPEAPAADSPATPPTPEPHEPRLDQALQGVVRADYAGARALAEAVQQERPDSARAAFVLALAYHKEKNYGAAEPHFERALALGPTFEPFAPVHYFRAWCLYYLGKLDAAEASFTRHLELAPDEADSHFGLGVIALDGGRLDEAERSLSKARELSQAELVAGNSGRRADVAKAHARLADVHLLRDDAEAARAALESCVRMYPPHYTAWYKLHQVLLTLDDAAGAAAALEQHDRWKAQVRPGSAGLGGAR
ncbi:MAG: tetratricopeptide repeat protein [Planctomycetota bacterium]